MAIEDGQSVLNYRHHRVLAMVTSFGSLSAEAIAAHLDFSLEDTEDALLFLASQGMASRADGPSVWRAK